MIKCFIASCAVSLACGLGWIVCFGATSDGGKSVSLDEAHDQAIQAVSLSSESDDMVLLLEERNYHSINTEAAIAGADKGSVVYRHLHIPISVPSTILAKASEGAEAPFKTCTMIISGLRGPSRSDVNVRLTGLLSWKDNISDVENTMTLKEVSRYPLPKGVYIKALLTLRCKGRKTKTSFVMMDILIEGVDLMDGANLPSYTVPTTAKSAKVFFTLIRDKEENKPANAPERGAATERTSKD